MYTWKNQLQHNLPTPAQQKTTGEGQTEPQNQLVGKTHQRKTQKEPKTEDIHRGNRNHSPRSVRAGDQGDCNTKSHRYSITEVYTINQEVRADKFKRQRLTRSLTNNGKTKKQSTNERKGGSLRKNDHRSSQLSDIEFKAMVIRKLNEITENYQQLEGN